MAIPVGYARSAIQFGGGSASGSRPAVTLSLKLNTATVEDAANALHDWCNEELQPELGNAFSCTSVVVRTDTDESIKTLSFTGARSGAQSPPNLAVLVRKHSGVTGRSGRGRTFWPGLLLDTEVNDSGTITGGRVTDLQTLMDSLVTGLDNAGGCQLALITADGSEGIAVSSYTVESMPATQRRRLRA